MANMALRPILPLLNFAHPAFQLKIPNEWRLPIPLLTLSSLASPFLNQIPNPSSILKDIWDGILRAVPKKKTPYGRGRSRRLVNKGLKDVSSIVKCPSCGKPKKSHFLCPYCVYATQLFFKNAWKSLGVAKAQPVEIKKKDSSLPIDMKPKGAKKAETKSTPSFTDLVSQMQ